MWQQTSRRTRYFNGRLLNLGAGDGAEDDPMWELLTKKNYTGVWVEPVAWKVAKLRENLAEFAPSALVVPNFASPETADEILEAILSLDESSSTGSHDDNDDDDDDDDASGLGAAAPGKVVVIGTTSAGHSLSESSSSRSPLRRTSVGTVRQRTHHNSTHGYLYGLFGEIDFKVLQF